MLLFETHIVIMVSLGVNTTINGQHVRYFYSIYDKDIQGRVSDNEKLHIFFLRKFSIHDRRR